MGISLLTPKILRDEHTMTILIWKSISVLKRTNTEFKVSQIYWVCIKLEWTSIVFKKLIQALISITLE